VRLFIIHRAMNFTHLPNAGGWYDQHPKLCDDWAYIMQTQSEYDEAKAAKETAARGGPRR
jgi:hypothetical protein